MDFLQGRLDLIRTRADEVAAALERGFDLSARHGDGVLVYLDDLERVGKVIEDAGHFVRVRTQSREFSFFRSEEWTPEKDSFLKAMYTNYTNRQLAQQLRCSIKSIEKRLQKLRLKRRFAWTKEADQYLLENSDKATGDLAKHLSTSVASVKGRLQRLRGRGAKPKKRRQTFAWTEEHDRFLISHLDRSNRWLAKELGTSVGSVKGRLRRLRTKKTIVNSNRRSARKSK